MEKEIASLNEYLSFLENPVYRIAEGLRENGYDIAGHMGIRQKKPTHNMVGILQDRKPLEKSVLGFKYNQPQRAFHLGTIWINNEDKGAKENEKWVLDVYGKKYQSKLTELVEKLALPYNVDVEVKLSSKTPKLETYLSDIGSS